MAWFVCPSLSLLIDGALVIFFTLLFAHIFGRAYSSPPPSSGRRRRRRFLIPTNVGRQIPSVLGASELQEIQDALDAVHQVGLLVADIKRDHHITSALPTTSSEDVRPSSFSDADSLSSDAEVDESDPSPSPLGLGSPSIHIDVLPTPPGNLQPTATLSTDKSPSPTTNHPCERDTGSKSDVGRLEPKKNALDEIRKMSDTLEKLTDVTNGLLLSGAATPASSLALLNAPSDPVVVRQGARPISSGSSFPHHLVLPPPHSPILDKMMDGPSRPRDSASARDLVKDDKNGDGAGEPQRHKKSVNSTCNEREKLFAPSDDVDRLSVVSESAITTRRRVEKMDVHEVDNNGSSCRFAFSHPVSTTHSRRRRMRGMLYLRDDQDGDDEDGRVDEGYVEGAHRVVHEEDDNDGVNGIIESSVVDVLDIPAEQSASPSTNGASAPPHMDSLGAIEPLWRAMDAQRRERSILRDASVQKVEEEVRMVERFVQSTRSALESPEFAHRMLIPQHDDARWGSSPREPYSRHRSAMFHEDGRIGLHPHHHHNDDDEYDDSSGGNGSEGNGSESEQYHKSMLAKADHFSQKEEEEEEEALISSSPPTTQSDGAAYDVENDDDDDDGLLGYASSGDEFAPGWSMEKSATMTPMVHTFDDISHMEENSLHIWHLTHET